MGRHVAPTTEHNRFSIVWVFQASVDIELPHIALTGGVIELLFCKIVDFSLFVNEKIVSLVCYEETTELFVLPKKRPETGPETGLSHIYKHDLREDEV